MLTSVQNMRIIRWGATEPSLGGRCTRYALVGQVYEICPGGAVVRDVLWMPGVRDMPWGARCTRYALEGQVYEMYFRCQVNKMCFALTWPGGAGV